MVDFKKRTLSEYLKAIGLHLLDGLTTEEGCILEDFPYEEFISLQERNEDVRIFIKKKEIEFKKAKLKEANKDGKNAIWILEQLRSGEFGKKRSTGDKAIDVLAEMVKQIQNDPRQAIIVRTREGLIGKERDGEQVDQPVLTVASVLK